MGIFQGVLLGALGVLGGSIRFMRLCSSPGQKPGGILTIRQGRVNLIGSISLTDRSLHDDLPT